MPKVRIDLMPITGHEQNISFQKAGSGRDADKLEFVGETKFAIVKGRGRVFCGLDLSKQGKGGKVHMREYFAFFEQTDADVLIDGRM